jgi:hypothetical protein
MIQKMNKRDTTIEEIHRTRQQMADKFAGDIAAILDDARKREAASGRARWRGPSSLVGPRSASPNDLLEPNAGAPTGANALLGGNDTDE